MSLLRKLMRVRQDREGMRHLPLLDNLTEEQVVYIRHLLSSWTGCPMSEANIHMPICRKAIRRALREKP